MENESKNNLIKNLFIMISVLFMVPTITYIILGKNIADINSDFSFFYTPVARGITVNKLIGTLLFVGIFLGLFVLYICIVKNATKLFKNDKSMAKYIIIVCAIFTIMLPMTSTDIYYYIGTGWSEAKYKVNPYYTSVNDVLEEQEANGEQLDQMLLKTPEVWRGQTIVYGPLWPLICKILSGLSFGNIGLALVIYKIFNLILHLISCYFVYKITNKKKIFVLLYALNPMILFNGLTNVHNDVLSLVLILGAIYFIKNKNNVVMAVVLTALATTVKYYAILLIPFLIIYHYRKEKVLKRILYSCGWALLFIGIIVGMYMVYMKDLMVLKGVLIQQSKFTNSIFLLIFLRNRELGVKLSRSCMIAFILIYLIVILKLLFTKKITFTKNMRKYNYLLFVFMFFTITAFQSWYVMWIFPTIMWQKQKMTNLLLGISFAVEISKAVYFAFSEWYMYSVYYYIIMLTITLITTLILNGTKRNKNYEQIEGQ